MRPHPGPPAPAQRGPHLPLQQLLRPHVLGEELLPGVAVGQRAVAQAACTEGQSGIGGQEEGVPSPQPSPAPLPARPGPFTFPTCQGRGVQAWQPRVLAGRGKRLHTGKERLSVRGSGSRRGGPAPATPPPSYLGVLDQEPRAVAVGALGTLPAASTADTAHTALAAHTIPVTCWRGRSKGVRVPVGPADS